MEAAGFNVETVRQVLREHGGDVLKTIDQLLAGGGPQTSDGSKLIFKDNSGLIKRTFSETWLIFRKKYSSLIFYSAHPRTIFIIITLFFLRR